MALTRAQLAQAAYVNNLLNQVNSALDILNNGGQVTGLAIVATKDTTTATVQPDFSQGGLGSVVRTFLTNWAASLQAQLNAWGVSN